MLDNKIFYNLGSNMVIQSIDTSTSPNVSISYDSTYSTDVVSINFDKVVNKENFVIYIDSHTNYINIGGNGGNNNTFFGGCKDYFIDGYMPSKANNLRFIHTNWAIGNATYSQGILSVYTRNITFNHGIYTIIAW